MTSKNTIPMDVIRDCSPTRPKLSKTSDRHAKQILEQMNHLRRNNELCDVCLNVGNSRIPAHKIVLSASSAYFRAMFTGELVESKQAEIVIRDIDEIQYLYLQAKEEVKQFMEQSQILVPKTDSMIQQETRAREHCISL